MKNRITGALKFSDVAIGQQIIFDTDLANPTVYTKTKPFTVKGKGRNKSKVSEIQFGGGPDEGRKQRAFCSDQDRIVFPVEVQDETL